MSVKTQNQERALFVLKKIKELKSSNYSEKLSSYILTNGLLPTLAFLKSKKEGEEIYSVLEEYLKSKLNIENSKQDIIEALVDTNATKLRLATIEAMELANWIRRLVKSEE